jgi:hypothetical protein
MAYNGSFEAALASIKAQKIVNYSATAKKYGLGDPTTLRLRAQGKRVTCKEAVARHHKLLNDIQEKALLALIDDWSSIGLSPTPHMVKVLVERQVGHDISKNWVTRFYHRHEDMISSVYLNAMDKSRVLSDNIPMFEYFYGQVRVSLFYFPFI